MYIKYFLLFLIYYISTENSLAYNNVYKEPTKEQRKEIERWKATLIPANVMDWGSLISEPDLDHQITIKIALIEMGCPGHIVEYLIRNSREKYWPPNLSTWDSRLLHISYLEGLDCKRIVGQQAVIVLASQNAHIPKELMANPGFVLIFKEGIETVKKSKSKSYRKKYFSLVKNAIIIKEKKKKS